MYLRKKAFPNPYDTWLSKVPECHFGQCTQGGCTRDLWKMLSSSKGLFLTCIKQAL